MSWWQPWLIGLVVWAVSWNYARAKDKQHDQIVHLLSQIRDRLPPPH